MRRNRKVMVYCTILFFIGAGISTSLGQEQQDVVFDDSNYVSTMPPDLMYYPTAHNFGDVAEGHTYQTTFEISNAGTGLLTWNLGIVHPWISPDPTTGNSTGFSDITVVTVTINTTGLSLGPHSGFVSISANDGGGTRYFNIDCNVVSNNPPNTPSPLNGPSTGEIEEWLSYTTSATDPDSDYIRYGMDVDSDGVVDFWSSSYYPSGATYQINIMLYSTGTYYLRMKAEDIHGAQSGFSAPKIISIVGANDPPLTPNVPNGPSIGDIGSSFTFSTSTTDPEGDDLKYGWDWDGDGTVDEWSTLLSSGSIDSRSHSWASEGTYNIQVLAEDEHGAQSAFSAFKTITITGESAPNKPSIPDGTSSGKAGVSYSYTTSTTDDNGDQLYYLFDWDDGTTSQWLGPYSSGQVASSSHIWSAQGSYQVRVKAKDDPNGDGDLSDGMESVWSDPLSVSMPKTHVFSRYPWFSTIQHFRNIFSF